MATGRRRRRKTNNGAFWAVGVIAALALALGVIAIVLWQKGSFPVVAILQEASEQTSSAAIAQSISTGTNSETTASSKSEASSAAVSSKIPAVIPDGEFVTPKGYTVVTKNGISTVDGVLIVNKTYSIPANYASGLSSEMLAAFNKMAAAAKEEKGYTLTIYSGFRSNATQIAVYNGHVASKGKARADVVSARPGHSEHETGLTADINYADSSIEPPEEIVQDFEKAKALEQEAQ
ncbi:MAG: D-alanyl-D-alanine carboxypeptidase family protein [Clostridia bacterium]|nr:D-alanyl-D-alanine carboxypeptidase family protein [Clostridia bacterium]